MNWQTAGSPQTGSIAGASRSVQSRSVTTPSLRVGEGSGWMVLLGIELAVVEGKGGALRIGHDRDPRDLDLDRPRVHRPPSSPTFASAASRSSVAR